MILYKYLSVERAQRVLSEQTLHFSLPTYFNDPFDTPRVATNGSIRSTNDFIDGIQARLKSLIYRSTSGILSLTRTTTNALMWAHYADSHKGVILGFDVGEAGFLEEDSNIIPAHFGSVIYTRQRVKGVYNSKSLSESVIGETFHFQSENYEKGQRLFLMKPLDWAYEEEVRVVKCVKGATAETPTIPSGTFKVINVDGNHMYFYRWPKTALREIHLGTNHHPTNVYDLTEFDDVKIFQCELDDDEYTFNSKDITSTYLP